MEFTNEFTQKLRNELSNNENESVEEFTKRVFDNLKDNEKNVLSQLQDHHENTLVHSIMVAHDVEYIAKNLRHTIWPHFKLYSNKEIQSLTIAALLHDLGKLYVHNTILDLGGKLDLEKIWKFNYPETQIPQNLMNTLKVIDVLNYNSRRHNSDQTTKEQAENYYNLFISWMKDKKVVDDFLNESVRTYLEYHQKGTELILKELKINPKIITYAASHHPMYFAQVEREKLPKEIKIIEIADKFNALMQTEGIRKYLQGNQKTKIQAMMIIIDALNELFKSSSFFINHINSFFNEKFEGQIIGILTKKYFTKEDIISDLKVKVEEAIKHGEDIKFLKEDEELVAVLIVALSFSQELDSELVNYFISFEHKLLEIIMHIEEKANSSNLQLKKAA